MLRKLGGISRTIWRSIFKAGFMMVNWKEDFEFLYCLFMLVSLISIFFAIVDSMGVQSSEILIVVIGVVEAVFGFFLFGSSYTSRLWNRLDKIKLPW